MAASSNEMNRAVHAVEGQAIANNPNAQNSAWDQFVQDYKSNFLNQYKPNSAYAFGSIGQGYAGIKSYQGWKQARRDQAYKEHVEGERLRGLQRAAPTSELVRTGPEGRTAQEAQRRAGLGQWMGQEEVEGGLRAEDLDRRRAGMEQQVEQYFADPARSQWQDQIVGNRLQADLGGIRDQYDRSLTGSVQSAAARGLAGGSVDVEGRGAVARNRDVSAIGAAEEADAARRSMRSGDANARQQLLSLVNSGSFADSQAFAGALRSINDATEQGGREYAMGQQRNELDQFRRQQQSQALGQGLNNFAGLIRQDPYRASRLSAWTGSGSSTQTGGW